MLSIENLSRVLSIKMLITTAIDFFLLLFFWEIKAWYFYQANDSLEMPSLIFPDKW